MSKVNDSSEVTAVSEVMDIPELTEIHYVTKEFVVSEVTWEVSVAQ